MRKQALEGLENQFEESKFIIRFWRTIKGLHLFACCCM